MIRFKCPKCGKEMSAGDENAGKQGRCPGCQQLFVIPGTTAVKPEWSIRTYPVKVLDHKVIVTA